MASRRRRRRHSAAHRARPLPGALPWLGGGTASAGPVGAGALLARAGGVQVRHLHVGRGANRCGRGLLRVRGLRRRLHRRPAPRPAALGRAGQHHRHLHRRPRRDARRFRHVRQVRAARGRAARHRAVALHLRARQVLHRAARAGWRGLLHRARQEGGAGDGRGGAGAGGRGRVARGARAGRGRCSPTSTRTRSTSIRPTSSGASPRRLACCWPSTTAAMPAIWTPCSISPRATIYC